MRSRRASIAVSRLSIRAVSTATALWSPVTILTCKRGWKVSAVRLGRSTTNTPRPLVTVCHKTFVIDDCLQGGQLKRSSKLLFASSYKLSSHRNDNKRYLYAHLVGVFYRFLCIRSYGIKKRYQTQHTPTAGFSTA